MSNRSSPRKMGEPCRCPTGAAPVRWGTLLSNRSHPRKMGGSSVFPVRWGKRFAYQGYLFICTAPLRWGIQETGETKTLGEVGSHFIHVEPSTSRKIGPTNRFALPPSMFSLWPGSGKFLHHHLRTKVGPVSCLGVRKKSKRWIGA